MFPLLCIIISPFLVSFPTVIIIMWPAIKTSTCSQHCTDTGTKDSFTITLANSFSLKSLSTSRVPYKWILLFIFSFLPHIYIYIYTYNLLLHVNTFSSRYATSAYIYQITTYLYHIKSILLSHHTSHMIHFHIFIMRFTPMHPAHLCNILHHAFEH